MAGSGTASVIHHTPLRTAAAAVNRRPVSVTPAASSGSAAPMTALTASGGALRGTASVIHHTPPRRPPA